MKMINQVKFTFFSRSVNESFARAALAAFLAQADPTVPSWPISRQQFRKRSPTVSSMHTRMRSEQSQ